MNKIKTALKAGKQLQEEIDGSNRCPITIGTRAMYTIDLYKEIIHELLAENKQLKEDLGEGPTGFLTK